MMIPHPRKLLTVALPIALVACFAGALRTLAQTWAGNSVYSFGFMLPLISGYLIATKKASLRRLHCQPDYPLGVSLLALALVMVAIGHVCGLIAAEMASIWIALVGFIAVRYGRRVLTEVRFPIAYLLLGLPIWSGQIERLHAPSQALSGTIAVGILHLLQIPAMHDGMTVILPNVALEVMRECSGVNQLVSIIAMSVPLAYLTLQGLPRRVFLLALGVAISYLSNGVRIALVGFLAYRGLGDGNLRSMHMLEGLAVSVIGYVLLFACISLLSRGQGRSEATEQRDVSPSAHVEPATPRFGSFVEAALIVITLGTATVLFLFRPADVSLRSDLRGFPGRIGDWTLDSGPETFGTRFPAIDDATLRAYPSPKGERRFSECDDELIRVYRRNSGERVHLFIGYHRSQRQGKEIAGEVSSLLASVALPVPIGLDGSTISLNEVVHDSGTEQRSLLFWYDVNGRVVTDVRAAKLYMIWDALTRLRTNGAVIMLSWESPNGPNAAASRQRALELAKAVLPLLTRYIPS